MELKKIILAASVAAALSTAAVSASATTILDTTAVIGSTFSDVVIGTIHIDSTSNLSGFVFAADSITYGSIGATLSLNSVTFSSASVGTSLVDTDASSSGYSYANVVAGDYLVKASGSLVANSGQVQNLSLLGTTYTVTAVPEPESYAMLLAGLGLMGTIARRRSKSSKA